MRCFGALAPGTTGPSVAVVTNTRFSQTIGDECPRPSTGLFHTMLFVLLHSSGGVLVAATPLPSAPRHCGQLAVIARGQARSTKQEPSVRKGLGFIIGFIGCLDT